MGKRNRKPAKNKDPKAEEDRQGRRLEGKNLAPGSGLGVPSGERSRSRSRLGRTGKKGRKNKEKKLPSVGLFVTKELNIAIETTKATVERIARECRAKNKRFRDSEFDLEYDTFRCLHGYSEKTGVIGKDVQRVTEIFSKPVFFPEGGAAHSASIRQGSLGDCYFLSALATVSGLPGLIEKICVARDEAVGIYGFIFYQDKGWVSVIVDDMLYTNIPEYESLGREAKGIYHEDKEKFESLARKGGQILVYAKAGTSDETWVPLIEKAYAKLYGCYAHTEGGHTCEAIEDLTGGVATNLNARDILDTDRFWKEELSRVNNDRLFACSFNGVDAPEDAPWQTPTVQGLVGRHAYAVLRAHEVNSRRFVVLRNPWGQSEWNGAWSDGSKEWTPEWLKFLPELKHSFGNDGQFVMEYKDFLRYFTTIDRVILFNSTWTVASCWLTVPIIPIPSAAAYGTLSFHVSIPKKTNTIFVLSTLNDRSYRSPPEERGPFLPFRIPVVVQGLETLLPPWNRGRWRLGLEAGDYIVYVKLDQSRILDPDSDYADWDVPPRNYPEIVNPSSLVVSKILTNKVKALSLVQNWDGVGEADFLVKSLEDVIKEDLDEMNGGDNDSDLETEDESGSTAQDADEGGTVGEVLPAPGEEGGEVTVPVPEGSDSDDTDDEPSAIEWVDLLEDKGEEIALGLRVYTQTKDEAALVTGRIRLADEMGEW
ncbi:cysteine proteinase [Coprinellus micaceus]|uniref:Cysteine proteinase n=1 Tax=Coprinellus micaceus TaxID=71717 RepID=A0A4Y7TI19_COPMI|nr:cysteine proteinase [Coprinellus micaceus]